MSVFVLRYEMVYRQAVSSEDMFLQLGNKTPMTSSCEELVVCYCLQLLSGFLFCTSSGHHARLFRVHVYNFPGTLASHKLSNPETWLSLV